uniref:guanylate cyclase n=1 Tax=Macrostomum lignano TaxID=282301 RepID=A0A1I8IR76_9PLAT
AECGDSKITVTYSSTRTGLYPVAVGILKSVASQIYNKEVEISVRQVSSDFLEGTAYVEQVSLEIQILSDDSPSQSSLPSRSTEQESEGILAECAGPQPLLSNAQLTSLLPYHLVLDRQMRIVQCGRKLRQFNSGIRPGAAFGEAFSIANPLVGAEFAEILRFINSAFTLAFRRLDGPPGGNDDAAPKELRGAPCVRKQRGGVAAHFAIPWRPRAASAAVSRREFRWCRCPQRGPPPESPGGQMRHLAEPDLLVFLGSLRVANLDQMQQDSLFMELITINQQQKADHTINQKLNEATTQLFKMTLALEEERQKTDNLLYQMLPKRVAEALRNGERVDAEKFSMVTVLFSDIVGFTDICSGSSPEAVITMLNSIFTLFDQHTEVHQVYKTPSIARHVQVETIGDAYMVVGGCPDRMEDHAQRVADQGLDMLESSRLVRAPGGEDGIQKIVARPSRPQIRVGMHSGPVVTGVVGEKMPRFCLFGDTVNTASRMESHGCPGLVHMSEPSYLLVKDSHVTEPRGKIYVKGKGEMKTYFLLGKAGSDCQVAMETAAEWKNVQTWDESKPPAASPAEAANAPPAKQNGMSRSAPGQIIETRSPSGDASGLSAKGTAAEAASVDEVRAASASSPSSRSSARLRRVFRFDFRLPPRRRLDSELLSDSTACMMSASLASTPCSRELRSPMLGPAGSASASAASGPRDSRCSTWYFTSSSRSSASSQLSSSSSGWAYSERRAVKYLSVPCCTKAPSIRCVLESLQMRRAIAAAELSVIQVTKSAQFEFRALTEGVPCRCLPAAGGSPKPLQDVGNVAQHSQRVAEERPVMELKDQLVAGVGPHLARAFLHQVECVLEHGDQQVEQQHRAVHRLRFLALAAALESSAGDVRRHDRGAVGADFVVVSQDVAELELAVHLPVGQVDDVFDELPGQRTVGVQQRLGGHSVGEKEHHQDGEEKHGVVDLTNSSTLGCGSSSVASFGCFSVTRVTKENSSRKTTAEATVLINFTCVLLPCLQSRVHVTRSLSIAVLTLTLECLSPPAPVDSPAGGLVSSHLSKMSAARPSKLSAAAPSWALASREPSDSARDFMLRNIMADTRALAMVSLVCGALHHNRPDQQVLSLVGAPVPARVRTAQHPARLGRHVQPDGAQEAFLRPASVSRFSRVPMLIPWSNRRDTNSVWLRARARSMLYSRSRPVSCSHLAFRSDEKISCAARSGRFQAMAMFSWVTTLSEVWRRKVSGSASFISQSTRLRISLELGSNSEEKCSSVMASISYLDVGDDVGSSAGALDNHDWRAGLDAHQRRLHVLAAALDDEVHARRHGAQVAAVAAASPSNHLLSNFLLEAGPEVDLGAEHGLGAVVAQQEVGVVRLQHRLALHRRGVVGVSALFVAHGAPGTDADEHNVSLAAASQLVVANRFSDKLHSLVFVAILIIPWRSFLIILSDIGRIFLAPPVTLTMSSGSGMRQVLVSSFHSRLGLEFRQSSRMYLAFWPSRASVRVVAVQPSTVQRFGSRAVRDRVSALASVMSVTAAAAAALEACQAAERLQQQILGLRGNIFGSQYGML